MTIKMEPNQKTPSKGEPIYLGLHEREYLGKVKKVTKKKDGSAEVEIRP